MSYQPPKKSSYGDELMDDNWSQSPPQNDYMNTASMLNPGGNLNSVSNLSPTQTTVQKQASVQKITNIARSVTQDDILFMRKWQRDSYVNRVIPISIAGFGALYLYNKSKGLPNKFSRYFMVGLAGHIVGKLSYKGEFKRRLAESKSDTPYMQSLRKLLNVTPIAPMDQFGQDPGIAYGQIPGNDSSNWNAVQIRADSRLSEPAEQPSSELPDHDSFYQSTGSLGNHDHEPKRAATYEELRAKNRGFTK